MLSASVREGERTARAGYTPTGEDTSRLRASPTTWTGYQRARAAGAEIITAHDTRHRLATTSPAADPAGEPWSSGHTGGMPRPRGE